MKQYLVTLENGVTGNIFANNWYEAKKQAWRRYGVRNIKSVKVVR